MKLAVTCNENCVYEHFGKTELFKVYTIEDGKITLKEDVKTFERGHNALTSFLDKLGVTALICGGIGEEARKILESRGIAVFGGIDGDVDEVVNSFIEGSLRDNKDYKNSDGCNCNCSCHGKDCCK